MNPANELFLLMVNLTQLHSREKVIELFIQGIEEIFKPLIFRYLSVSEINSDNMIEIRTRKSEFGVIQYDPDINSEEEKKILLINSVQMVAIILERLNIDQELLIQKKELEVIASKKLIELKQVVNELEDVRTASVNLIEDLTIEVEKRKAAEESIRKAENYFRFLIEKAPDGIVLIGPDGKMFYASPSAHLIFGYPLDYPVLPDPNESTHPDDLPGVLYTLGELIKNPSLVPTIEYRFKTANGKWSWIESTFSNHLGEEAINAIVINFRDISERKKAEMELKESELKFKRLVWDMQVGVILQGPDTEIILCNPMSLELLGLSEGQLLGKTSFDPDWNVIHEDGSPFPGSTHPVSRAIATKKSVRNVVMGVFRPGNNDRVWLLVDAEPILDIDGNVRQVVCTFIDITIRKQAEEELILKNLVFEESIAANSISDINGIITSINSAFVKTWGYNSKEEVIGRPISEFLEYENETEEILKSLSSSGKYSGEYTAMRKDKSTFRAYSLATVVYDNAGKIIGYQSSVQDITAKHIAESALRESEKKYRYLFEINPNVMWIYDLETLAFIEVNEAAVTNYGYSKSEFLKMTIRDIRPEDDIPLLLDDVAHTTKPLNRAGIWRHKKKNGEIIFVEIISHLTEYENRKARLVIANDITERKLAQETLMQSEEKFRVLYESMKQGVFYQMADGRLVDINPAGLEMFGITLDQFMGRTSYDPEWKVVDENHVPLKPEDHPSMVALKTEKDVDVVVGVYNPRHETYKWLSVNAKPQFVEKDKKPFQVFVTMHDITDLVQAEEVIRLLNDDLEKRVFERTEQLEYANKELEAFSYSVSHDLRAPLRAIHSFTNILREDYGHVLDDEGKRVCGVIATSTVHMGQLIDDLLAFSRIGRVELGFGKIDMAKLVKSAFEELTSDVEKARIRFTVNKMSPAFGDNSTIKQVIINLLSNAVKYTSKSEKPEITVGMNESKYGAEYYVRDNGVGFDMQYAHKLFGVFQRLHSTKEFEGNGVGLAIVQRIIKRHGGRIWAEGETGKGASFFFTLPQKKPESINENNENVGKQ